MSKKDLFKKYLEKNSQTRRLERIILGIKEEARLRSNNELLNVFKNKYSEEMEKINTKINIFEKRKKELKKKLMLVEDCVTNNVKIVLIRIYQKEMEQMNQKKRKQKNRKGNYNTLDGPYWSWSTTSRRTPKPIKNKSIVFISSCNLSYC